MRFFYRFDKQRKVDSDDKYPWLLIGPTCLSDFKSVSLSLIPLVCLVAILFFFPETRWRLHNWLLPHLDVSIPIVPGSPYVLYRLSLGLITELARITWFAAETAVTVVFARSGVMRIGTALGGLWPAWRRKAGKSSDTGSTSKDSLLPEGRLLIDEAPVMEVEVETSLPGKSPRASPEARGRASGSERSPSGDRSGPARPSPARGSGRRRALRALLHHPVGQREGGTKNSSSTSSSHKKKKSSSSSSGEAKKRARDRSPHRSPAQSSLPGTPRSSRVEASGPLPSPPRVVRTPVPLTPVARGVILVDPRTPVPSASKPALGPGTPAGGSLPALPLPQQ